MMHLLDWALLVLIAAAAITAILPLPVCGGGNPTQKSLNIITC